jgi:hypothetical protein
MRRGVRQIGAPAEQQFFDIQNKEREEMTQFKKFTFALAAVVALVVWASTAKAQVAFQMSSNVRTVRAEGLAEAVGALTLTVTTNGDISALSTIAIDYGVDIVADENTAGHPDPGVVITGAGACFAGATFDAGDIDGGVLIIEYPALTSCVVGNSIVISGIRVDANAAGAGATINAKATATAPAGGFPITFFIVNQVPVAEVETAFDITIDQGRQVLTCAETLEVAVVDPTDPTDDELAQLVGITIEENFNQAFSDSADETGYANYSGLEIDTEFTVTFKDVPEDVNIELIAINLDSPGDLLVLSGSIVGDEDDAGGDIEFTFEIEATASTGANEEIQLLFNVSTGDPIDSVNGSVTVDVGVEFAAGDLADGEVPEFVDNEVEDPGFDVSDCLTRLMFPWVVSAVAGYDTGITIANTTEDDVGFNATSDINGAEAQTGTCKLTGYPAAGGTVISYTTPNIAAGRTQPIVMSQTTGFNGFSGYVLAVCNFLNAHAFAFLIDGFGSVAGPRVAEGYTANVVGVGDRTLPAGEALGH